VREQLPILSWVSRHKLDFVHRILHEGLEEWAGVDMRPSQRVARIHRKNRLDVEVFSPLQELK
jgi:hypothetical protein